MEMLASMFVRGNQPARWLQCSDAGGAEPSGREHWSERI